MKDTVFELLVLFVIGSVFGWCLEFIYRGFIKKNHQVVNPGFLSGPYLPLYGSGAIVFTLAGSLTIPFAGKIILVIVGATLLELVTGEFFLQVFNIRLWDYSDQRFNFRGHICLAFSLAWGVIGAIFLMFLYEPLVALAGILEQGSYHLFWFGLFYGVFFSDVYNAFNLAARITTSMKNLQEKAEKIRTIDYRSLRLSTRLRQKETRPLLGRYLFPFNHQSRQDLEKHIRIILDRRQKRKKES